MRSIYYKFLLFLVVAALAAPFILRDHDGRPLMRVDQLHMPRLSMPELPAVGDVVDQARRELNMAQEEETHRTTVYKWRDANGLWHYSDDPGPDTAHDAPVEPVDLDPDANLASYNSRDEPRQPADAAPPSPPAAEAAAGAGGLSSGQVTGLLERARQVDQLLESRHARQQRALERM